MITSLSALKDIANIINDVALSEYAALISPGYGGVIAALIGA